VKQIFIQFGGTGDLVQKKLLPAYETLLDQGHDFHVIALGRRFSDQESYISFIGLDEQSSLRGKLHYVQYSMESSSSKLSLINLLHSLIGDTCYIELIYYIALQPSLYESAIYDIRDVHERLQGCELQKKIVVEKPFGFDRDSAVHYNRILQSAFTDDEIYRVDHYLGKDFMQSLLVMRFYNDVFKGIWNKHFIDHIQIIFDETYGVDQRLGFYEQIGVVRDTIQNHILQIITHLTMGEPVAFTPVEISHEKRKVLRSIAPVTDFSLAQYSSLKEAKDGPIHTPTYCSMKLYVDTFDFAGVPIYVRTGKMQKQAQSLIYIAFKHFRTSSDRQQDLVDNAMIITLHPQMTIDLQINMKEPDSPWGSKPVRFNFDHFSTFGVNTPEAYQQIIEKIIVSDKSLFPSIEEITDAWMAVEPMLAESSLEIENHADRSLPESARSLIETDGRTWFA